MHNKKQTSVQEVLKTDSNSAFSPFFSEDESHVTLDVTVARRG